ncbi:hypothetical protein [Halomontanus rarus]|uniref:hypothetical protein n=1 Tax=Halomontanus rarus TaxID=3034020 RepID=UPI00307BD634
MSVVIERHDESAWTGDATSRYFAAALAFTSQAIHLWILPDTFVVTLLPGLFFFLVAIGQGLLGVSLLFGPGRWTLRLGISFNLLVVALWTITRFVSLPALTGSAQLNVGMLGIVSTVAEIALVMSLLKLLGSEQ